MIEAARGALGHWVKIENQKISQYQIITPTAWNASPRDAQMKRGPWEKSADRYGCGIAGQSRRSGACDSIL